MKDKSSDNSHIKNAIKNFSKKRILVIGDIMLDHYVFGEVARISPEAPIPVLKKVREEYMPGGAGNVASNLSSLGAKVWVAGIVGNDHAFLTLKKMFKEKKINFEAVLVNPDKPTITKERFVSRDQHMLRLDTEETTMLPPSDEKKFEVMIKKVLKNCDGIIFSDYAKGCFSKRLAQSIIKIAKKSKKPVFADIKPQNKDYFRGVKVITPNLKEALEMTGEKEVYKAGKKLQDFYKTDIVITKSQDGISIFKKNGKVIDVPTKSVTVLDVSGAGDTFISAQVLSFLSGLSLEDSGIVANAAGTIVVQKPGTAVINQEELVSAIETHNHTESIDAVPKLWGYEKWLENNDKYCCKLLSINKGYQCSLHYHKEKDEMFFVTKGHVRLESDGEVIHMRAGNFARILPGTKHRFRGIEDSMIIEVSTHHEESDSYRIEKSRKVDTDRDVIRKTSKKSKIKTVSRIRLHPKTSKLVN